MVTSREWLVQQNLAKQGKGRLSREAQAALMQAIAEGIEFSDRTTDGKLKPYVPKRAPKTSSDPVAKDVPAIDESPLELKPATKPKVSQLTAPRPVEHQQQRDETVIWGVCLPTKPGQTAMNIVIRDCAACGRSVSYCTHKTPKLPKWLNHTKEYEDGRWEPATKEELLELSKIPQTVDV